MSRVPFPYVCTDISALAKSLGGQLAACDHPPGHVELLNMLARAAGSRNFQHFRAQAVARDRLESVPSVTPSPEPVDYLRVRRMLRLYDPAGGLIRWPPKLHERQLALWVLWSQVPAGTVLTEKAVNDLLAGHHRFGDHALLRRWLVEEGMMVRTPDGREYRRVERRPPPEALALIRHLRDAAGGA